MPNPESVAGQDFHAKRSGNTIALTGRLDFTTATQALEAVTLHMQDAKTDAAPIEDQAKNTKKDPCIIDMSGVTDSNSAGLAVMIEWLAVAQRCEQQITFQNIPGSLHQISTVCQVDSLI